MTISSAKRKFIYEHLWLHLWLFLTPKKRKAQNIYGSLMIIFDKKSQESPESIQNPSEAFRQFMTLQSTYKTK